MTCLHNHDQILEFLRKIFLKGFQIYQNYLCALNFSCNLLYFLGYQVVGPFANATDLLFGSYAATPEPEFITTVLEGLSPLATKTRFAAGCENDPTCQNYDQGGIKTAVTGADLVVVCLGTSMNMTVDIDIWKLCFNTVLTYPMQFVCLKEYRECHSYQKTPSYGTYMYIIVRNNVMFIIFVDNDQHWHRYVLCASV